MVPVMLLVMLLVWSSPGHAATYYVDIAGSNTNDGLTEETPFRTIAKGITMLLGPGDTVLVKNGTYAESGELRIRYGGTPTSPVRLAAYPGHSPVLEFPLEPDESNLGLNHVLLQRSPGHNLPIADVVIEGITIHRGVNAIKGYNCTRCIFRHIYFKNQYRSAILLDSSIDTVIDRNVIEDAGQPGFAHGLYLTGSRLRITNNLIYGSEKYGVQMRGDRTYNATDHAGPEYALTVDGIIANNVLAYSIASAGVVVWGVNDDRMRIENNIFYENWQTGPTTNPNGVSCISCSGATGVLIRNNLFYASGSGGLVGIDEDLVEGVNYTQSGNTVNTTTPGFVDAPATKPAAPDFRLLSNSGAIGMARVNEFPQNATLAVGAFATIGNPACSITTNKINCIFPMSTAVPIQNLSTPGVTIGCTGANCPGGGLTASTVSRVTGTDTHVEITVAGFAGNACVSTNQTLTLSYNSATGTWTGNDNIGSYPGLHQKVFSFTNLAVTNLCTGSGPASYPAGYHIFYKLDENTGTNVNDESANNLDGTFTNTPTWGPGKTGSGMVVAAGSTQHTAIPWGNGVNPSTQSLTIVHPVQIAVGAESLTHYVAGPSHGTNQRAYVCGLNGTWRIALQATTCANTTASSLAVTSGWNHLVLRFDSTTDTATLYKNGVAGTGGASVAYTSFTFESNWTLGRVATLASSGGTYDDFLVYLSLEDPAALYEVFQAEASIPGGTMAQAAVQFQGVYLDVTSNVISFGALNSTQEVVANGGVAVIFQIHCQNISDCDPTAFKLMYAKNQTAAAARAAGTALQVPNTETSDGIWMWGSSTAGMNTGVTTMRLTGTCAVTNGSTQVTAEQVPSVDLPQDGCVMLRYVVRVGNVAGSYFELFLVTESGQVLAGGYVDARLTVVNPRASGVGF